ncbi:MAG: hypothetical protein IPL08_21480 [Saprospiraceae bacterium]|nr:hypothetical protein [Saprospiraceae bacterium]
MNPESILSLIVYFAQGKWVMTLVSQYAGLHYDFIHDKINADLRIDIRMNVIFSWTQFSLIK